MLKFSSGRDEPSPILLRFICPKEDWSIVGKISFQDQKIKLFIKRTFIVSKCWIGQSANNPQHMLWILCWWHNTHAANVFEQHVYVFAHQSWSANKYYVAIASYTAFWIWTDHSNKVTDCVLNMDVTLSLPCVYQSGGSAAIHVVSYS